MTILPDRERAFELAFAHDEELRFRALARRNRLVASWAAEQIGLRGRELEGYVRSFVEGAALHESDEQVVARLCADLTGTEQPVSETAGRSAMATALAAAVQQVRA